MDGAEVGVLEETDEVSLAGLLQGHDGRALEAQIGLEVLCNLTNETLEDQHADEKLGALLVTTDLTGSDCSRPVTVRFLDSSSGRCALSGSLGGELLPRASGPCLRWTCERSASYAPSLSFWSSIDDDLN